MRVVITGGAGFIGSHLCDYFIAKGHSVVAVDNLLTGDMRNVRHLLKNKKFTFIKRDVIKSIPVSGKVDAVLHFASPASPIDYMKHPFETLEAGSTGTRNALDLALKHKAVFMLASTSEIYGDPLINPQVESYWGNVNTIGPRSVYDEAKRYAEAITMAYHRYHKLQVRIVRIFNTYGPRMQRNDGRAVPEFIGRSLKNKPVTVFGKGKQTRSFCYVSDLVSGLYKLLMSEHNEPVNLGNTHEITLIKLAHIIIGLTKSSSKIVYKPLPVDDPKLRRPDITKARKLLKWNPVVNLKNGLTRTIDYFRDK